MRFPPRRKEGEEADSCLLSACHPWPFRCLLPCTCQPFGGSLCIWLFTEVIWRDLLGHRYLQNITIPAAFVTKTVGDILKGLIRPTRKDREPTAMVSMDWTDILPRSEVVCPPHPPLHPSPLVVLAHTACIACVLVCCYCRLKLANLNPPPPPPTSAFARIFLIAASSAASYFSRLCSESMLYTMFTIWMQVHWEFWSNANDMCGPVCDIQKAFMKVPSALHLCHARSPIVHPCYQPS